MVDDVSEYKFYVFFKDEVEIEDEFQKVVEGLEQVCRMGGIISVVFIILFLSLKIFVVYFYFSFKRNDFFYFQEVKIKEGIDILK